MPKMPRQMINERSVKRLILLQAFLQDEYVLIMHGCRRQFRNNISGPLFNTRYRARDQR